VEDKFEEKMAAVGDLALNLIADYFKAKPEGKEEADPRVEKAFKFIGHPIKVRHMAQHRMLTERSQAIRLLPYLKNQEAREEYIKMTQPQAAPLLEHRPQK